MCGWESKCTLRTTSFARQTKNTAWQLFVSGILFLNILFHATHLSAYLPSCRGKSKPQICSFTVNEGVMFQRWITFPAFIDCREKASDKRGYRDTLANRKKPVHWVLMKRGGEKSIMLHRRPDYRSDPTCHSLQPTSSVFSTEWNSAEIHSSFSFIVRSL